MQVSRPRNGLPLIALLASIFAFSCATRVPGHFQDAASEPYTLTHEDESLIRLVFGSAFLEELRPRIVRRDLGNPVYKAAFIPTTDEIWLNSRVQATPLALLHEATHYYQKNRLGRKMATSGSYDLRADFTALVDIEQEAMLVMHYASLLGAEGADLQDSRHPSLDVTLRYLRRFMGIEPPLLAVAAR